MNTELVYHIHRHTIPAALALLPGRMDTPEARAMLIAIGLQESQFTYRNQINGPAHGFWECERGGGVKGVLTNPNTAAMLIPVFQVLRYRADLDEIYNAISDNDVLACIIARLILYLVPGTLPEHDEPDEGWEQYVAGWRPGKPRRETWDACFEEAWRTVTQD